MTEDNVFYVYDHWRPDKGACFYVGKGKGKRAWDLKNQRNRYHKAITSKLISLGLAVDVRIVISGLSSATALSLEIDRISMYGVENLSNMTGGGDGMSNPTIETLKKISDSRRATFAKMTPEERRERLGRGKGFFVSAETRKKLSLSSTGRRHKPDAKARISAARKAAGMPRHVIEASIKAKLGKKRAPFKESTILKMRAASVERERIKREKKHVAISEVQLKLVS